jgi:hypothetical protein
MSSDIAPKIRGGATMSYLFSKEKPFLLEREISYLNNTWQSLTDRARDLEITPPEEDDVFTDPDRFNRQSAAMLRKIKASSTWDMNKKLSVLIEHLLSGNDLPVFDMKIKSNNYINMSL